MKKTVLITGGAGFIGCHVVKRFVRQYPDYTIINADSLTYAGNLENLRDVENISNYIFEKVDISDEKAVQTLFQKYQPEGVIHLAAESHVDRSITDPLAFVKTNVLGTVNLLNEAKKCWGTDFSNKIFHHVSTDEVYGALGDTGLFTETTAYDPHSPYSASKASSDHFVRAYADTYGLPVVLSNCSNNYGPNQFPEKLIPLCILNILEGKPLPIYGDGKYTRDWLYVIDHAEAIDIIFHKGKHRESYNVGGFNEWKNIDLVHELCDQMDLKLKREAGDSRKLITFVKDRPGHDLRYAIDARKLEKELAWRPSLTFEEGLSKTIDWYLENQKWLRNVASGAYRDYYDNQYNQ
ncbi:MAG TPA: dTDP-glucose 4,6-dehydratase [Sphingobacterium sp.]|nr:dTDP-glucose 4,6-dehydratase [Sphingobacterium sp.]